MIRFSSGHAFEYMTASGALRFDGKGWPWEQPFRWVGLLDPSLFTSVTKTLTLRQTEGNHRWYNPFRCIRLIQDGVANAIRLTNPGFYWWHEKIGSSVDSKKISLVVSFAGEPDELAEMVKAANELDLVGLEFNASCPNEENIILQTPMKIREGCEAIRENSCLPLILKISVGQDVEQIVNKVESLVDAFSINSVPW
jgi:dihydroorotate dehydrogenase